MTLDEFSNLLEGVGTFALAIAAFMAFRSWRTEHLGKEKVSVAIKLLEAYLIAGSNVKRACLAFVEGDGKTANKLMGMMLDRMDVMDRYGVQAMLMWEEMADIHSGIYSSLIDIIQPAEEDKLAIDTEKLEQLNELILKATRILIREVRSTPLHRVAKKWLQETEYEKQVWGD